MTGGGAKFNMHVKKWYSDQEGIPGDYSQLEADVFNILGIIVKDETLVGKDGLFIYKNRLLEEYGFTEGINKTIEQALDEISISEINNILDKIKTLIKLRQQDAYEQCRRMKDKNTRIHQSHLKFITKMGNLMKRVIEHKKKQNEITKEDFEEININLIDLDEIINDDDLFHLWWENADVSGYTIIKDPDADVYCPGCENAGLLAEQCLDNSECVLRNTVREDTEGSDAAAAGAPIDTMDGDLYCYGCEGDNLHLLQCIRGNDCLYSESK
jgi:hypothetical protein